MPNSQWKIAGFDRPTAVRLTRNGLNPLLAVLLASRGIVEPEAVDRMICPDDLTLYDPFLLKDMDRAVARLKLAIERHEHIAVHGDYDVDGLTAATLVCRYFRAKGLTCDVYIPERQEGYGLRNDALDAFRADGVSLLITVDCGITAVAEAEYARSIGLDLIISDHHECRDVLPEAVAVIDPKRRDSAYPNASLAGVGVAFKLICAMEPANAAMALLDTYGDLVALGTIADVMPVLDENRLIIIRGMEVLRQHPCPGLLALAHSAGFTDSAALTVTSVGFALAPRINAAGRMGSIATALSLLLADSEEMAAPAAEQLCELNRQRQALVDEMYGEALAMQQASAMENSPIIIASDHWYQGVAGIVASRLSEHFMLPALVICIDGEYGRGSCRSVEDFNLFQALESCSELLTHFGGHEMAAGFSVPVEKIPELSRRVRAAYAEQMTGPAQPALAVDFEVTKPGLLTVENIASLAALEPYGNMNPTPVLCIRDGLAVSITPIGGGKHTKFVLRKNGESLDCICFSKTVDDLQLHEGCSVDVAFTPQINNFRGRTSVQLTLTDLKPCKKGALHGSSSL